MRERLPRTWENWPLDNVGEWSGGGTPASSNAAFWDGDIPWVSPKDMKVNEITSTQDRITQAAVDNSAAKLIPARSVLFVTRSGILAHSFPVATNGVEVTVNQDLKAITPVAVIDTEYLAWVLRSSERQILSTCSKHGTTVHSIEIPALKELEIPVPPFNEQRRIVAKIEELFSELDKGIEALTTVREQLQAYRMALVKSVLDGSLTYADSEHWRVSTVGELLTGIRYGTAKKCAVDPTKTPVLRIPNVAGGRIDLSDLKHTDFTADELDKLRLEAGDILVVRSNGSVSLVGLSAVVPDSAAGYAYAGYLIRLRLNRDIVLPEFLNLCFSSPAVRTLVERQARSTSGVHNINTDEIKAIPVRLPGLTVQARIVKTVTALLSETDAMEDTTETELARSAALRQAVLTKAFSGQLVEQDPADEPASVLLERICAERGSAKTSTESKKQRTARSSKRAGKKAA